MTAVRMMQTPVHQVVRVVAVWDRFVSAARAVGVTGAGDVRRPTRSAIAGVGQLSSHQVRLRATGTRPHVMRFRLWAVRRHSADRDGLTFLKMVVESDMPACDLAVS
jgi:hypothetical protein